MLFGWYPLNWWMSSFSHLHVFQGSGKHNRYFGRKKICFDPHTCPLISPDRHCLRCQEQLSKAHMTIENQDNAVPLEVWALSGESLRTVPLLLVLYIAKSYGSSGRIPSRVKGTDSPGRISILANYYCFLHCISIFNYTFIFAVAVLCSLWYKKDRQMLLKEYLHKQSGFCSKMNLQIGSGC